MNGVLAKSTEPRKNSWHIIGTTQAYRMNDFFHGLVSNDQNRQIQGEYSKIFMYPEIH